MQFVRLWKVDDSSSFPKNDTNMMLVLRHQSQHANDTVQEPTLSSISFLTSTTDGFSIQIPQLTATAGVPFTVAWSLGPGDPTSFGLLEKDINNGEITSIIPVNAGAESSGFAGLTFPTAGQYVIQGILQQSLLVGETGSSIGGAPQVGVIGAISTSLGENNVQPDPSSSTPKISITTSPTPPDSTSSPLATPRSSQTVAPETTLPSPAPSSSSSSSSSVDTSSVSSSAATSTSEIPSSSSHPTSSSPTLVTIPISTQLSSTITSAASASSNTTLPGASASHSNGGLSYTAKKIIILAVTGTVVVGGTVMIMYIRKRKFIKQRRQLASFRQRLARIPGLSVFAVPQVEGSEWSSFGGHSVRGSTIMISETRSGRDYPVSRGNSISSGQILF
ncbi:hypothetical protein D9757_010683 [Collybiopsis confluens]|uniref:Uncharacterized protein n=1 Tax=Collybiopsis confluens TaxID=2823264 RepID=A0A8H5H9J6_9AGAR|nr:hypothetical protein D9757_010683 [Collybiopsis confluens]